ncbi:MAG TPA: ATP-binding protein [Myxococcales bacterium]|nr:ATP-binding protein [Myxococcales bacterium]
MADEEVSGLLIEDSPSDALLLQELVSRSRPPFKFVHVERLQQGLDLLQERSFDIVLLDLTLPDAKGIETVIRTHAARPAVPIVVLTGTDDEHTAIQAMHAGAQDYLVKGQTDRGLLIRSILYARERKRMEEANHRIVREQAARASAEAAERNARFLAEASRALAATLDYEAALATLARMATPAVADCCLIDLVQGNGHLRRVASASLDGASPEPWREELEELPRGEGGPVEEVLGTGDVVDLTAPPEETIRRLRLPEAWLERTPRSIVSVPMQARGRTLGAITFVSWSAARRPAPVSLLAMELASGAALAVDNGRLFRAREQIIEVVSHDLRTPLTMILGNLTLIQDFKSPPKQPLEVISRAAQQMSQLVEDLLDMSRLEHGTFALDLQPVDVAALLNEVAQLMSSTSEIRGVQLQVIPSGELPAVNADKRRLQQVLWNLIGNGFKFTQSGGKVELRARAQDRALRVEVADNGPGIPETRIPHLFGRFWQGEPGDARGVGLGLSIAKAIVEAHGGSIGVTSSPSGTTFFFTLPRESGEGQR